MKFLYFIKVKKVKSYLRKMNKNTIVNYAKRRPGDVSQVYADTKKSIKLLKWRPKYNNLKIRNNFLTVKIQSKYSYLKIT